MKLNAKQRQDLFNKFGGMCAYCGDHLPIKGWHADHIEPIHREWWKKRILVNYEVVEGKMVRTETKQKIGCLHPERDVYENFFPACRACNIDKGPCPLEMWRTSLENRIEVCRRNHPAFRHAERFKRIVVVTTPLLFHFETYSATPEPVKAGVL